MKLRFEAIYRAALLVLCVMLVWSTWAAEQAATNLTTTVAVGQTNNVTSVTTTLKAEREPLLTFGLDRIELLNRHVVGIPLWQYIASLFYVFLAVVAARLADYVIGVQLKKWALKTNTRLDELLLQIVHGPIKIIAFVLLLHIGLRVFEWPEWVEAWLSNALQVIVAISLTYMALKVVDISVNYWKEHAAARGDKAFDEQLFPIIRKSIKIFIVIVAALVTSQNLGVNITGVIASLSIGGLAIGLAAQDTLANLFGAVAVFVDKPFRLGDRIRLPEADGTVESIGLRSTRVRNLDGHLITVPNKTMGNATITNITLRPNIKTEMNIGITYDTPVAKVKEAAQMLSDIYRAHPQTQDLIISFNKFADSSLNILVLHWWAGTDFKVYLAGMHEMNLSVKERFDAAGISFAFPSQTVYLRQDSQWRVASPSGNGEPHAEAPAPASTRAI